MAKTEWRNRITKSAEVAPETILPNPENYREHPDRQQRLMSGALNELGWVQPVIVNSRSGRLIDGHMRVALAIRRAEKTVPVNYVDLSEEEERVALATIDPLGELARQNDNDLRSLLAQVSVKDRDLKDLLSELDKDAGGDQDSSEETRETLMAKNRVDELRAKWKVKPGDVWQAGTHRIGCLDATDPKAIAKLMGAKKAHLVFTDPPYGVAYQASGHEEIKNDALTGDALVDFLVKSFKNMEANAYDDAGFYIWHATSSRDEFTHALKRAGLLEKQYLIWAKPQPTLGHADYQQAHEPCFYASKAGHQPRWFGGRDKNTVWVIAQADAERASATLTGGLMISAGDRRLWLSDKSPKGKKLRTFRIEPGERLELNEPGDESDIWIVGRDTTKPFHPTQKPIELAARAIRNSTEPGDIVVDLFLGSGSTAVAAERTGRTCYGTDYDAGYVAVILERLSEEGLKPERIDESA
jgi:DNA modification methylase